MPNDEQKIQTDNQGVDFKPILPAKTQAAIKKLLGDPKKTRQQNEFARYVGKVFQRFLQLSYSSERGGQIVFGDLVDFCEEYLESLQTYKRTVNALRNKANDLEALQHKLENMFSTQFESAIVTIRAESPEAKKGLPIGNLQFQKSRTNVKFVVPREQMEIEDLP